MIWTCSAAGLIPSASHIGGGAGRHLRRRSALLGGCAQPAGDDRRFYQALRKCRFNKRTTLAALTSIRMAECYLSDARSRLPLAALPATISLRGGTARFFARNVMIRTQGQSACVLALLALDGVAQRLLLCPARCSGCPAPQLMRDGEAELVVTDDDISLEPPAPAPAAAAPRLRIGVMSHIRHVRNPQAACCTRFASLTAPLRDGPTDEHGGMGHVLPTYAAMAGCRFCCAHSSAAVPWCCQRPASRWPPSSRAWGGAGVTHISGTPSHWRRALMSGAAARIAPRYVRLFRRDGRAGYSGPPAPPPTPGPG